MKIQYAAPGIRVFESALFQTTATVLDTPDLVLVVDPNWLPEEVMAIRRYVDDILDGRPVYVLFTHSDYDHIIGYGAFMEAKTIASEAFATETDQDAALARVKKWDQEYYIERDYPALYPQIDVVARQPGQAFALGKTRLIFFPAPGHNNDGLFTLATWEGRCIWLAGDYLSAVEFPFIYHSSEAYEQTLHLAAEILEQYQPELLVAGHGPATVSQKEMTQRISDALSYIQTMRQCIRENLPFPEEHLWQRYLFRKGQESFHQDNAVLMQKELDAQRG
ncbi:MAG: MBL fold metallo-hydrolase [Saprospiraceae bacterium]|nr:MBL fold metallo-hydrolase [Saprospiraceae bacterium]